MGDAQVNVTADPYLKASTRSTTLNFDASGTPMAVAATQLGVPWLASCWVRQTLASSQANPNNSFTCQYSNFNPVGGYNNSPLYTFDVTTTGLNAYQTECDIAWQFALLSSIWQTWGVQGIMYSYNDGTSWSYSDETSPHYTKGDYVMWETSIGSAEFSSLHQTAIRIRLGLSHGTGSMQQCLVEYRFRFSIT